MIAALSHAVVPLWALASILTSCCRIRSWAAALARRKRL